MLQRNHGFCGVATNMIGKIHTNLNPQPSPLIVFLVLATGARDHVIPYQAMAVLGMCKQTNKNVI